MNGYSFLFGFMFCFPIIVILVFSNAYFTNIHVDFSLTKSYEAEYKKLLNDYNDLEEKLKEKQKIVCECKSNGSLYSLFWGFFVGALSMGYFILVGYPWLKNKIEKRKTQ